MERKGREVDRHRFFFIRRNKQINKDNSLLITSYLCCVKTSKQTCFNQLYSAMSWILLCICLKAVSAQAGLTLLILMLLLPNIRARYMLRYAQLDLLGNVWCHINSLRSFFPMTLWALVGRNLSYALICPTWYSGAGRMRKGTNHVQEQVQQEGPEKEGYWFWSLVWRMAVSLLQGFADI